MSNTCPLCGNSDTAHFHSDNRREYWQCAECALVFVPKAFHLSQELEKAEYDKHENTLDDPGYLKFLARVIDPLTDRLYQKVERQVLSVDALQGLDFGCGPGPALANELNKNGFKTDIYDIYYCDDRTKLNKTYDFVTCTEVIEHFNAPKRDIELLVSLMKPQGLLAIMTKLVINKERFASWHYKNDLTHVSFFSVATFQFIAARYGLSVEFEGNDVILLTRSH